MKKKKAMWLFFCVITVGISAFSLLSHYKLPYNDNDWVETARPRAYEVATRYMSEQLPHGSKGKYSAYSPDMCQMVEGDMYKATLHVDVTDSSGKHTRMKCIVRVHAAHFDNKNQTFFDWFILDSERKAL